MNEWFHMTLDGKETIPDLLEWPLYQLGYIWLLVRESCQFKLAQNMLFHIPEPIYQREVEFKVVQLNSVKQIQIFFFFFFGCTQDIWKFLSQGSKLSCSCNQCHRYSNAGPLICCARPGIEPMPPQKQCQIINPLLYNRNSSKINL